jgi:small GTP-binding protein
MISTFKVLLVGDPDVGKSSLIRRLLLGEFDEEYVATVGVDLSAVVVEISPHTPVILTLVDLGGQREFSNLRTHYYRDAHFAVLVYDISNRGSFDALPGWFEGMSVALSRSHRGLSKGIVLGNKSDKINERTVSFKEGQQYAESLGWQFMEASAKTGDNVAAAFTSIASQLVEQFPLRQA